MKMKEISYIFSLISLLIQVSCSKEFVNCSEELGFDLSYSTYDHYFVRDSYQIDSLGSFLEINDTSLFNRVFGPAAINEKITWIGSSDFNNNFVLAVIKESGYNLYDLRISKIKLIRGGKCITTIVTRT